MIPPAALEGELRWSLGKEAAVLKFAEDADSFTIILVMVPHAHRGLGIGSALVLRVLSLADACGKEVRLSARPVPCRDAALLLRLERYYERFGFRVVDRGLTATHMVRPRRFVGAAGREA